MPGPDGALMIDGGLAANADALLAAVRSATGTSRIHTLINTHWHPEQTGANEAVGRAGGVIFAHEKTKMSLSNTVVLGDVQGPRGARCPQAARPTRTTRGDGSMEFAGQQIDYGYMPAAHTDGDLFVHFPKMNLLVVGGVVSAEEWPLLDYQNGAWLGGRVRALERLADLVKPDTRVVPANGRVMTGSDIVRHRDMYQKLFTDDDRLSEHGARSRRRRGAQPAQGIPGRVRRPVRLHLRRPPEHDDRLRAGLSPRPASRHTEGECGR